MMGTYYAEQSINSAFMNDYMTITSSYSSFIMLLLIPFFAFFTKLGFRKWGHNYYEHIVLNSYVLCYYTLFYILLVYPLMFIFKGNIGFFISLTSLSMLAILFILVWFFKELYPDKSLKSVIGRVALTIVLMTIGFALLIVLIASAVSIYAANNGPAGLEYIKAK
jgi:hypothetical protein